MWGAIVDPEHAYRCDLYGSVGLFLLFFSPAYPQSVRAAWGLQGLLQSVSIAMFSSQFSFILLDFHLKGICLFVCLFAQGALGGVWGRDTPALDLHVNVALWVTGEHKKCYLFHHEKFPPGSRVMCCVCGWCCLGWGGTWRGPSAGARNGAGAFSETRSPVKSGLQRKHCTLKESKYVDFESFSLSVLFWAGFRPSQSHNPCCWKPSWFVGAHPDPITGDGSTQL